MADVRRAFLLESGSGAVAAVQSPILLAGMQAPAEYYDIVKAVGDPSIGSKRLREKYGTTLDGVLCATRPFDFYLYAFATTLNTYHTRAIRAKVKDIVGREWSITGDGPDSQREQIATFFGGAFGELTFDEGIGNVWTDYEALGNGFLEVVPTKRGDAPAELTHIPATEMWIRLDGLGYVQLKNGQYAHFRRFGVPKNDYADLRVNDPLAGEDVTSIIHFSRYFPWSLYYGIPPIMPAWNRMVLSVLETEYNLHFFGNNAIPDYAVILDGEWGDDAELLIREYFRTHLKGQAHKTLDTQTPTGGKITFEKLTSENAKEGSFRLLRTDCRDEILHAHGVPPQKVGIHDTGRLGGNSSTAQSDEYKNSIVLPGQNKVVTRLNRIIEHGFGITGLRFEFKPYDTADIKANADTDAIYLDRQVLTPNEVRAARFPELNNLPGGEDPLERPGETPPVGDELRQMQQRIMDLVRQGADPK